MKGKCEVCNDQESKYKCPSCLLLYCSLGCYRQHKATQCNIQPDDARNEGQNKNEMIVDSKEEGEIRDSSSVTQNVDEDDWVSPEKLQLLGHSDEVKNQLRNKHLQKLLIDVDSSPNPGEKLDEAMQIPIFTEFVDVCMKIIEGEGGK